MHLHYRRKTAVTLVLGALSQLWLYADEHIRDDNTIRASVDDIDQSSESRTSAISCPLTGLRSSTRTM